MYYETYSGKGCTKTFARVNIGGFFTGEEIIQITLTKVYGTQTLIAVQCASVNHTKIRDSYIGIIEKKKIDKCG